MVLLVALHAVSLPPAKTLKYRLLVEYVMAVATPFEAVLVFFRPLHAQVAHLLYWKDTP